MLKNIIYAFLGLILNLSVFANCAPHKVHDCNPKCGLDNQGEPCSCKCDDGKVINGSCGWIGGLHSCHEIEKTAPINL
jgi:hypothetical protein